MMKTVKLRGVEVGAGMPKVIVPIVATMGGIPIWLIISPVRKPIRVHNTIEIRDATRGCIPSIIIIAVSTPLTAMIAPTDRSIPPVRITKVMPMAQMPLMDTCRSTLAMLPPVRKLGAKMLIAPNRTTKIIIIAYSAIHVLKFILLFVIFFPLQSRIV